MKCYRRVLMILVVSVVLVLAASFKFSRLPTRRCYRTLSPIHVNSLETISLQLLPLRYGRQCHQYLRCSSKSINVSISAAAVSSTDAVTSPDVKSIMLFELPGEAFTIRSTAAYIQKWANDATSDGSSLKLESLVDGIHISFSVDPETSFLKLQAVHLESLQTDRSPADVFIKASLANSSPNIQIRPLVSFAAENLLAGFINTINSLLLENYSEESTNKSDDTAQNTVDDVSSNDLKGIDVTFDGDNVKIDIDTTRNESDDEDEDGWSSDSEELSAEQIKEMERTIAGLWREVPLDEPTPAPARPSSTVTSQPIPPAQVILDRNILFSWDGVIRSSEFGTVLNVLQSSLQEKYSGKGAGIEIVATSLGVVVSFAIARDQPSTNGSSSSSGSSYSIEFKEDREMSKTVISSNRDLFLDQQQRLQSSGTFSDNELNAVLLQRAISNLESYLVAQAERLQVSFATADDFKSDTAMQADLKTATIVDTASISNKEARGGDGNGDGDGRHTSTKGSTDTGERLSNKLPDTNELFIDENDMNDLWKTASVVSSVDIDDCSIAGSVSNNRNYPPTSSQPQKAFKKDPRLLEQAMEMGFKLESYENKGLESQAVKELEDMVANARSRGFIDIIRKVNSEENTVYNTGHNSTGTSSTSDSSSKPPRFNATELFQEGSRLSKMNLVKTLTDILSRPNPFMEEDMSQPPTKLPFINNGGNGLRIDPEALDIFEGPPIDVGGAAASGSTSKESSKDRMRFLNTIDATPPNTATVELDKQRLLLLITDLNRNPTDVHDMILGSFRDLMLSENLLYLLRQANATSAGGSSMWESSDNRFIKDKQVIRDLLSKVSSYAAKVNLELVSLIEDESKRHLETIYQICDVSYKFQADELRFLEEIEYLKPKFDTELLSYLKFAIETEIDNIRLKGSDPVTMPSPWLQILQVVYQGVLAEFETRFDRLLEPLLLAMRFDEPDVRKELLKRFVNITTALDLRYMKTMASNMANNVINNFEKFNDGDRGLYEKMIQLQEDIEEFLSDRIIDDKVEEFTNMAKEQGVEIVWRHRNPEKQDILNEFEKQERAESVFSESDGKLPKGLSSSVLEISGSSRGRLQDIQTPELPGHNTSQ